ncbi:hypothetical protein GW869_01010 [bacterium]|uniref:Uncharacterized protein n=3 Tax=Candidatus Nealsoniibacteriota TaxID=1817911 RepID=A0A2M7EBG1_9BACT|nr:hypothetical protein [bacterium]PIV65014.1 MAG: hypothetical protein COS09_01780 [Candidatus Nealsonbacteria bacterium CG01_land_8_20_14_3_00_12]PIW34950.1 MAG: hypothetical protein COW25_01600 [Candidatus Nealsonbacteria bacterium CG15_BIG_FIL_POST_REV_8_21_14_020_37_12]PJA82697.1 MAG: hypothetical protein CO146_02630 [Candidatus Nealsonbacteria bacterium CG_4_9_14_3_um_filter_37_29]
MNSISGTLPTWFIQDLFRKFLKERRRRQKMEAIQHELDELIEKFGGYFLRKRDEFPDRAPSFRPFCFGLADEWLESLSKLFLAIPKRLAAPQIFEVERKYQSQHRSFIFGAAEKIRQKKAYHFFIDALKAIERRFDLPFPLYVQELKEARPTLASFLLTELLLLWALMEKEGKLLVCVRDGHQRKHILLPENPEDRMTFILQVGQQILTFLPFITPQHLDLVPERFGPIHNVDRESIRVPVLLNQSIPEILEDAYFHQRYVLHPVGAAVQLRDAYDIEGMLVKVVEGKVIARISTARGETIAMIDLETGQGVDFIMAHEGPVAEVKNALALFVATVYHDLVVGIETPARRKRKYTVDQQRMAMAFPEKEPTFIYIPRKIRVGGEIREVSPRIPMTIRRPPRVHPVRGYLKKGWLSEHHRDELEEFERATGLKILERIPSGKTFIRPHFSPRCDEEGGVIVQYPLFVKRRLEAEMLGGRA